MFELHKVHRAMRTVAVAHAEAFQLMLYRDEKTGLPDMWVWNSRDGVTPFVTITHTHAMNAYLPGYSAILPNEATHVWVDYDRVAWEVMNREKFARFSHEDVPHSEAFRERFPSVSDWLAFSVFEPGQPRLLTRRQFFEETASYVGRYAGTAEAVN